MKSPTHLTTEENSNEIKNPILVVDKEGIIGKELILRLGKNAQVIFVTRSKLYFPDEFSGSVLYVPFIKKVPSIPDGNYSFIFIIDSVVSKIQELLPSFLEKAEKDKIPVLFATPLPKDDDYVAILVRKYSKLKVLIYGDVFDINLSLHQEALVNRFLYEAFAYEKIEVPADGLQRTYPVYLNDLTTAILEAVFGTHSTQQIFFAFPKHPPTALAIARAIKRAKPEIKIDFSSAKEVISKPVPNVGLYLLGESYSLEEKIKEVVSASPTTQSGKQDLEKYIKEKVNAQDKPRKFSGLPVLFFLLFLLVLPLVTTLASSLFGVMGLSQAQVSFSKGNMSSATSWAERSKVFFSIARATYEPLYFEANMLGLASRLSPLGQNIEAGGDIAGAVVSFSDAYEKFSGVLSGKSNNPAEDFSDANLKLSDALVAVRKLEGSKELDSTLLAKIEENKKLLNFVAEIQNVLPQLIGIEGKRDYLVLFQNSMELRPTGGFMGSYGLLSLNKGKIVGFTVSDVYDADGQLKGHVEPPYPIRRYLPSEHWYLRDSNFDLDFPKAASASAFFLKTEMKQDVDGVVAINVFFVENVLKAMGGVMVPEYNETVTAENFVRLAQEYSQKNFFPGSTQKKDFLGAVFRAMQQNFAAKKDISYIFLAKVIEKSIESKDILLASFDPVTAGFFKVNNWSSSLWDSRKDAEGLVNDFLAINEANLGVNKVNYFVTRSVTKNATVNADGEIFSDVNIAYENSSDGSWPGGDYKSYLRIVVPSGASLSAITIDGEVQEISDAITDPLVYERSSFRPPDALEVEKSEQEGKDIYGFLISVPKKSQKTITVTYSLEQRLGTAETSTYSLRILKQPGVTSLPFDFSFSYPQTQSVVSVSEGINKRSGSVSLKKDIIKDEDLVINLAKNE
ncbi:MAG: DUF4012 domain-containing protein [Candidatus Levyibacteriota bacterium]